MRRNELLTKPFRRQTRAQAVTPRKGHSRKVKRASSGRQSKILLELKRNTASPVMVLMIIHHICFKAIDPKVSVFFLRQRVQRNCANMGKKSFLGEELPAGVYK